jgi:hypothetical protein
MRKLTWEVSPLNKVRCEVCKGAFGLTRHRFAYKQFCSKHCLERYQAERVQLVSTFKERIDLSRRH